jgi:hypothetical protein
VVQRWWERSGVEVVLVHLLVCTASLKGLGLLLESTAVKLFHAGHAPDPLPPVSQPPAHTHTQACPSIPSGQLATVWGSFLVARPDGWAWQHQTWNICVRPCAAHMNALQHGPVGRHVCVYACADPVVYICMHAALSDLPQQPYVQKTRYVTVSWPFTAVCNHTT